MKPQRLALPHWLIWDAEALQAVPAPVHRAATYLATAYWRGGCQPLPDDVITISMLAKLPPQHFRPLKAAVFTALATILPELNRERDKLLRNYPQAVQHAKRMREAQAQKRVDRLRQRQEDALNERHVAPRVVNAHTPIGNLPPPWMIDANGVARESNDTPRPDDTPRVIPPAPGATFKD